MVMMMVMTMMMMMIMMMTNGDTAIAIGKLGSSEMNPSVICSRRREGSQVEQGSQTAVEDRWLQLVRRALRVARLRRIWAALGHWLRELRARGGRAPAEGR